MNLLRLFRRPSTVAERMAARTSPFQLITRVPYLVPASAQCPSGIDPKKPLCHRWSVSYVGDMEDLTKARILTHTIRSADDIVMCASLVYESVEALALKIRDDLRDALWEAARNPAAETARYIVVGHPFLKRPGRSETSHAVVLRNDAAPESDTVLIVDLIPLEVPYTSFKDGMGPRNLYMRG